MFGKVHLNSNYSLSPLNYVGLNPSFNALDKNLTNKDSKIDEEKIKAAKEDIINTLKTQHIEQGYLINPDGSVHNSKGEAYSCSINPSLIQKGGILLHGHPNKTPLSTQDVVFLLTTDAISQEAVSKDGSFSKLTKKTQFKIDKNPQALYLDLEKIIYSKVLDRLKIDYKENENDVILLADKAFGNNLFIDFTKLSYEEVLEKLNKIGIDTSLNPQEIANILKNQFLIPKDYNNYKYDKLNNKIFENMDKIKEYLSTKEGIKLGHDFLKELADKYNMVYETDMI